MGLEDWVGLKFRLCFLRGLFIPSRLAWSVSVGGVLLLEC